MFSVVTISRQIGSGGSSFAKTLSLKLGYPLIWREVINQAAIKIGSPEVALAMIDELGLLGLCPEPEVCTAYVESVSQVMRDYADKGRVIIVGRASQVVLQDQPNTLHLRIIADMETRTKNIMEKHHIKENAAMEQIKQSDGYRENYLSKFHQVDWNNPSLYDLVINTAKFSINELADWVAEIVEGK